MQSLLLRDACRYVGRVILRLIDGIVCDDALEGYDPSVSCECPECDVTWRVYLTPEQALRLGLMHAHA